MDTALSWSGIAALIVVVCCLVGVVLGPLIAVFSICANLFLVPRRFSAVSAALRAPDAAPEEPSPSGQHRLSIRPVLVDSNETLRNTLYGQSLEDGPQSEGFRFPRIVRRGGAVFGFLTECDFPVSFALTRESVIDTLGKSIGLSSELQTGSTDFDRSVYISCENHRTMMTYLSAERRAVILDLFKAGFAQIVYVRKTKTLALISGTLLPTRSWRSEHTERLVKYMHTLVPTGQSFSPEQSATLNKTKERIAWRQKIRGVEALALVLLCLVYFIGINAVREVVSGDGAGSLVASISAVLFTAYVVSEVFRVKGTSTAHREVIRAMIAGGIIIPLSSWYFLVLANQMLDQGETFKQDATFTGIDEPSRRTHRRPYYLTFTFQDPSGPTRSVAYGVSRSTAESLKRHSPGPAVVFLKPGMFGIRHAIGYELR